MDQPEIELTSEQLEHLANCLIQCKKFRKQLVYNKNIDYPPIVVLVPMSDRSVLIDYKTDSIPADQVPARATAYHPQTAAYAEAVRRITGKPVEVVLVFFRPRVVHRT